MDLIAYYVLPTEARWLLRLVRRKAARTDALGAPLAVDPVRGATKLASLASDAASKRFAAALAEAEAALGPLLALWRALAPAREALRDAARVEAATRSPLDSPRRATPPAPTASTRRCAARPGPARASGADVGGPGQVAGAERELEALASRAAASGALLPPPAAQGDADRGREAAAMEPWLARIEGRRPRRPFPALVVAVLTLGLSLLLEEACTEAGRALLRRVLRDECAALRARLAALAPLASALPPAPPPDDAFAPPLAALRGAGGERQARRGGRLLLQLVCVCPARSAPPAPAAPDNAAQGGAAGWWLLLGPGPRWAAGGAALVAGAAHPALRSLRAPAGRRLAAAGGLLWGGAFAVRHAALEGPVARGGAFILAAAAAAARARFALWQQSAGGGGLASLAAQVPRPVQRRTPGLAVVEGAGAGQVREVEEAAGLAAPRLPRVHTAPQPQHNRELELEPPQI
eukprot:tig00000144_g9030.t1